MPINTNDTKKFFLAESVKEGDGCIDHFLDDDNNNNNDGVNINIVEVSNNEEQSPNNGFIDLDLVELTPRITDCFRRKRDGLENGGNKDIFVFDSGNTEHHKSAHLPTKHCRKIPAWFKS